MSYVDPALKSLVAALRARYPGVRIVWAFLRPIHSAQLQQIIRYQAPLERLKACGLVTPAMLERPDGYGTTELGDGFHLCEALDTASRPGHWDLSISTGETPRERRFSLHEAKRQLQAFSLEAIARRRSK